MTVHAFQPRPEPAIPTFDGKEVHTTKVKLVFPSGLDIDNAVLLIDDVTHMQLELICVAVNHVMNARGEIERVQTLKVLETGLFDAEGGSRGPRA